MGKEDIARVLALADRRKEWRKERQATSGPPSSPPPRITQAESRARRQALRDANIARLKELMAPKD
jgi:hypothetical protein